MTMIYFPCLTGARLTLRSIQLADLPRIIELASNPAVSATTVMIPHPYQEKDAINWLNLAKQGFESGERYVFAIELTAEKQFVGGIGLAIRRPVDEAEVGYWLGEPYWNRGLATEALALVLEFGFSKLQLHKIFAHHMAHNAASGKVMRKNGMIQEERLRGLVQKGEHYYDSLHYRLTAPKFEALRGRMPKPSGNAGAGT